MGIMDIFKSKATMPSANWLEEAERRVDFTPDMAWLEQTEFQLLFIYDELMKIHRGYNLFSDASVYLGAAYTVNPHTMWKKSLGEFSQAIALEDQYSWLPHTKIKGELHAVRPYRYIELDKFKLNGYHFTRKRTYVIIPYRERLWHREMQGKHLSDQKVAMVKCWMYVGVPEYWKDLLDNWHPSKSYQLQPVTVYEGRSTFLPKYYYFSRKELDVSS